MTALTTPLRCVCAALLGGVLAARGAESAMDAAWRHAAQLLNREANEEFQRLARERNGADRREARLGEAVTLLQVPPLSPGRVQDSAERLRALVAENAADETGLAARYYLGRIRQVFPGDGSEAGEPAEFLALVREHPGNIFAQLAMVKLTLDRLYAPAAAPGVAQRLAVVAQFEHALTVPALLRDYHLAVGNAEIYFRNSDREALRHLRAALALGLPDDLSRADVLVQIGELARGLDEQAVARESYARFLREFHHDVRILMVRDRLTELEKGGAREKN